MKQNSKILIVTNRNSWLVKYLKKIKKIKFKVLHDHTKIKKKIDIIFYLSYSRIVKKKYLLNSNFNMVVHASDLPRGRGFSPYTWEILKKKKKITLSLFKINPSLSIVDSGDIYKKILFKVSDTDLIEDIRKKIVINTFDLINSFLNNKNKKFFKQKGMPSYYRKRTPLDSKINLNKKFKDLIPLFKVVDNKRYPAHFFYKKCKFILKIYKDKNYRY
jgi:methionyl-tRNA formyltransferase